MPKSTSRLDYMRQHRHARAWAALDRALNAQMQIAEQPHMPERDSMNGKHAVVIGSGVGGLTTAYELLAHNSDLRVTVLEARDRTGGRCLSLRTGDTLTEDRDSALQSQPGETQMVRFERPVGDQEPYLNAGPGRIPSSHWRLLDYLRRFGVAVEVYVMDSASNLSQMEGGPLGDAPVVNRQIDHDTRGWIAEMVYQSAEELLGPEDASLVDDLRSLMVSFGSLDSQGRYVVGTSAPGEDDNAEASDRAGFTELPGVRPGRIAGAITLAELLRSQFWQKTRFYQPEEFLWQPTLFQPVGGMDQVQHAFAQQVAVLGGVVHLNSPVTTIDLDEEGRFVITATGHQSPFVADYCFCNVAMPFLERILSPRLQAPDQKGGFNRVFKEGLQAVYKAQANPSETERFLAVTTKVGWQADRKLWQARSGERRRGKSELGVVPIYGGISWTDHAITQIWYPSTGYHDQLGVLTGCYNFDEDAAEYGRMSVQERLAAARVGAARFGERFAEGLRHGVTVAWQNMAYIKGGWAQWHNVENSVRHFNAIIQGTGVDGDPKPRFFIVGDQVSSLPGWQEGAISSALNAITRLSRPDLELPHLMALPDTRVMVQSL